MKRYYYLPIICTLLLASLLQNSAHAADVCHLSANRVSVNYGEFDAERMERGITEFSGAMQRWLAPARETFSLRVDCDKPQKIRLFFDGIARQNALFRFSSHGAMVVTVQNARVDNQSVLIVPVTWGQPQLNQPGTAELKLTPGQGIGFRIDEERVGLSMTILLTVLPYLSPQVFDVRERVTLEEVIHVSLENLTP